MTPFIKQLVLADTAIMRRLRRPGILFNFACLAILAAEAFAGPREPLPGDFIVGTIEKTDSALTRGLAYFAAPIFVSLDVGLDGLAAKLNGRDPKDSMKKKFSKDQTYLEGYAGIAVGLYGVKKAFIEIDASRFESWSAKRMNQHPKKVVYLSSIGRDDKLAGFPEFDFTRKYGGNPNASFIQFSNLDELIAKLKALPQDESIDRFEFLFHGNPGKGHFADGSIASAADLNKLVDSNIRVAAPNAEIKLISCSLGANTFFGKPGDAFMNTLGKGLLPNGGNIFAATKNILLSRADFPDAIRTNLRKTSISKEMFQRTLLHATGVGNMPDLLAVLAGANRNFIQASRGTIRIRVPGRKSVCREVFSSLAH